jgi:hypothetical protein
MKSLHIENFSLDDLEDPFEFEQMGGGEGNEPEPEPEPEPVDVEEAEEDEATNAPRGDDAALDVLEDNGSMYETDPGESETEMDSSVDPEANSPESIDPEDNSPESVDPEANTPEAEPEPVDAPEANAPEAEPEPVDAPEPDDLSLPSDDIILDDEDIIIDQEKGVEINDEEIIPEEKVVANEKDQSEDLFNEIMKMVPEKHRTNRTFIKRSQTIVKNCMKLKVNFSSNVIDPTNIFKLNLKLKTENYRPSLEKLLSLNFEDHFILPIVNDKRVLYDILNEEYAEMLNGNLDELDDNSFIKADNVEKINSAIALRESYRKGKGRFNYSYNEEMSRLHSMMLPYAPDVTKSNLNKVLDADTRVFRDTFTEDKITYNKLKLEKAQFSTHTVLHNDEINIVGFVRLPKEFYKLNNINTVPLSSIIYDNNNNMDFFRNLSVNIEQEHLKVDLEVGDTVLLNFNNEDGSLLINGIIDEFDATTNSILVVMEKTGDSSGSPDKLKIQVDDPAVDIINTTYSERKTQADYSNKLKVFLFGENGDLSLNDIRLRKYLNNVIPSTNNALEIIRKKSKFSEFSISTINQVLSEFNLNLDDFVSSQLVEIMKILRTNLKSKLIELEKEDRTYNRFLKNPPEPKRVKTSLISDKTLKDLEPLYGPYPHKNLSTDTDSARLNWIYTRVDNGEYFFRNIVKGIVDKFNFEPSELIGKIQEKRTKLVNDLYIIEGDIGTMKYAIIYEGNQCPQNRIVKEYLTYNALENDNERDNVEIDDDKRVYGDMDPYVRPGMFCVLNVDDKKKLFKRTRLDSGGEIWVLETAMDADHLVYLNKDFCEYQQKKLSELNSQLFLNPNCAFNEMENRCVTKELDKKITEKYDLENRIKELDENIKNLLEESEKEPIDKTLEKLQFIIQSNNELQQRLYQNVEKDAAEEKKVEVDPEHELLYKKIDLYLEKISKLENTEKYNLLDILISKYGRDAIEANDPPENPLNVYCKYGSKVLCCSCDKRMGQLFKSDDDFDHGLRTLIDDFGIEEDGMYWCKNCGREIHIADYETTEGFNKNGARDVTHEAVEREEDVGGGAKNSELFDSLKMFLNAEDGGITTDNKLDIMKIYKCILTQMGVTLKEEDELNVLKTVSGICTTNIKPKLEWMSTYKGKPKSLDKAFNLYVSINTIMYTVSYLFLILQSSMPEYKITKTHQKCVSSLDGFPLTETGDSGVNYLQCIIESLMASKDEWSSLKKIKLEPTLKTTLTKLSQDEYIKYRMKLKRKYLEEQLEVVDKIPPLNVWDEFRPPLKTYDINNKQIDAMGQREMQQLKGIDMRNLKNYLSLRFISEVDKKINSEPVENFLFNPAQLGNSCCLSQVGESVNFMNFFKEDANITEIYTKLLFVFSNKSLNSIDNKSIYKTLNDDVYTYPTFKNNVFPSVNDIQPDEIKGLFETYIPMGEFKGFKRIFYNDTCIFTNQTRNEITQVDYSFEQYLDLLKTIQNINLNELEEYRTENKLNKKIVTTEDNSNKPKTVMVEDDVNSINTLKNIIIILSKNQVLSSNPYLNVFFEKIRSEIDVEQIKELWKDFKLQKTVVIEEIGDIISELIDEKTGNETKVSLSKLGELQNIFADNEDSVDYDYAKTIGINTKIRLIKKYLYSYLFAIPTKVKNNMGSSEINPKEKPANWNISQNYVKHLGDIVKGTNLICDKYILEKKSNDEQIIFDSMSSFIKKNNVDLRILCSKEHEFSCEGAIIVYSKCVSRNLANLIHYMFLVIFKELLQLDLVMAEKIKKSMKAPDLVKTGDDEVRDEDFERTNADEDVLNALNELEDPSKLVPDKPKQFEPAQRLRIATFLVDILTEIEKDRKFLDKHSKTNIAEGIEKKLESEKENNLAVMKDLDKESRQSLTNMIKLGMTTWKNLSKKTDLDLHFGETIEEGGEMDQANGDNDFEPVQFDEDIQENLRDMARQQLGENYTTEEYAEWNDRRLANQREDMEAMRDAAIMPDDDGDDFGMEAEGDDAYY